MPGPGGSEPHGQVWGAVLPLGGKRAQSGHRGTQAQILRRYCILPPSRMLRDDRAEAW